MADHGEDRGVVHGAAGDGVFGGAIPAGAAAAALQARRESTTNYEVDKTVRVVRAASGTVKRLNAAVVVNHRTDRIRKIVVDSGTQHLGTWREHRRNLVEDYRRAFEEEPGPLLSVAKMTDSDNTRSQAKAWYGHIIWSNTGR